ncbi:hypothetical protein FC682_11790 [Peribacillus simplex]|uniref:GIY-YIG nuclease family protein n=1 Tax=Peribacillus simplex TaxID=1478 RepID=UPI0010BEA301|nr:GIY-YIG nuclease family protein [Peribacillus simplex]TKH04815.1 hypothetical protein FC682_11790 [Peribacillus simplex]
MKSCFNTRIGNTVVEKPNLEKIVSVYIWQLEKFPNESGVYKIYGVNGELLYVGEAQDIQIRIGQHYKERYGKYKRVKATRKRVLETLLKVAQENAEKAKQQIILPDRNYAQYKPYFFKVEFYVCSNIERKIYELLFIQENKPKFNIKDNFNFASNKEAAVAAENYLKQYKHELDYTENSFLEGAEWCGASPEDYVIFDYLLRESGEDKGHAGTLGDIYENFDKSKIQECKEKFSEEFGVTTDEINLQALDIALDPYTIYSEKANLLKKKYAELDYLEAD